MQSKLICFKHIAPVKIYYFHSTNAVAISLRVQFYKKKQKNSLDVSNGDKERGDELRVPDAERVFGGLVFIDDDLLGAVCPGARLLGAVSGHEGAALEGVLRPAGSDHVRDHGQVLPRAGRLRHVL